MQREGKPIDGRERLLDQAAGLFLQHGYAETSLRHIAAAAGMQPASVYYHFASKDDLFIAILERGMDVMEAAFDEAAIDEAGGSPRPDERLLAHVRAHLRALAENGPYTAAHVTAFRTAPDSVRAVIVPRRDAYENRWTQLLGDLLPGRTKRDITLLRLMLFGAMNASIDWFDAGRGSLDLFATTVTEQFWFGTHSPVPTEPVPTPTRTEERAA